MRKIRAQNCILNTLITQIQHITEISALSKKTLTLRSMKRLNATTVIRRVTS